MNRPRIICHMLVSLNGKISGPFIADERAAGACDHYERIDAFYKSQGWINGRVTVDENFTFYKKPDFTGIEPVSSLDDYIAPHEETSFFVAFDLRGSLGWEQRALKYESRPSVHIVEVVGRNADPRYLGYLRKVGISYLVVGEQDPCTAAMEKLHELLNVERIMLEGGGVLNESFVKADLVDEISLVMSPIYDTSADTHSAFEGKDGEVGVRGFRLKEVQALDGGDVWLRYERP